MATDGTDGQVGTTGRTTQACGECGRSLTDLEVERNEMENEDQSGNAYRCSECQGVKASEAAETPEQ